MKVLVLAAADRTGQAVVDRTVAVVVGHEIGALVDTDSGFPGPV